MTWLIPPQVHPLLLLSPFSLLFSFIYITHSNPPLPLLLPSVPLLLCLLFLCYYPPFSCYSVSSSPVTTPVPLLLCLLTLCYYPLFSCYPVFLLPCPPSLSCKECLPVLSTGAFTLSKTRPFKHAEHAFLSSWRRPSCPLNMPFLETRVQVFDSKEVTIVKETDMISFSKWFG